MSTSSTLNSVLTALGGSTGIDVTSEVNTILYADRAPERGWQAQQTTLANQTSAINQLETEASSLSDSLNALSAIDGVLASATATSSNSSLLTATAAGGTAASNHSVTITNLATAGSWYSDAESSSSATLPTGSFSITVGSTTTAIPTGSGVNTLDELAASINSQSLGVTANVVTDSSGARLALTSSVTGSAGDFSISSGGSLGFTRSGTGADASLTVDGVPITSASNTVTGAISGVTLNLLGASTGTPISLSIAPDTSSITTAVSNYVTAYNTLIKDVNTQIGYDKSTGTAGVLESDSSAQGLQSALLASTNYNAGSGAYPTLDSLGVTTNADGTLSLNSATLTAAVQANGGAVASFFQGSALNGFAQSVTSSLNIYTDPAQGAFTVDLQSISSENQELTTETSTLELYLSSQQTILTAKYNAADIAIQQLPQEIKQIQALLNPNSSNSNS
jgi:flagellar hook-associated protein 2